MLDPRYTQLAEILVHKCVETRPGDHVWIRSISTESLPLAREVYKQIVLAGAHPIYDISDDAVSAFFYKHATAEQLNHKPDVMEFVATLADKTITIVGEPNKRELANTDPKKIVERSRLIRPVKDVIMAKPWVLTYVPTHGMAQDAQMSYDEFEDFYFTATNRNWQEVQDRMQSYAKFLTDAKDLHIVGEKTDLHMSVQGRTWIYDDWKANMPGGEVFTSPVANTVEGEIFFSFPLLRQGKIIRDIHLFFENGKVVKATASEGQDALEHLLDTDEDARRLGEVAIGGNPGITSYMYNMLFDEKMAGTIHCALGQGFEECGGETQSALHMDIVKDMTTPGSTITVDGKLFMKDGKIVLDQK
ncbi:aminopeptidase [Candidatus Woesebacteria bacterium]|nr:aminopeptidase [Candidatus Woesebacteria bacterium]MCD8507332.1 aminopeptidase [Candidatus Woesebacteria bacterium]MCD8527579.1 aminopeptidase [Candidatus Woesebacteria bacterium]MCD8546448.1 aminopeptidase [Candidatus Woesebacteria bacterium]